MTPAEVERLTHETYAVHCMLLNLGFEKEQIFVGTPMVANMEPPGRYAIVAAERDGKRFVMPLYPVYAREDRKRFLSAWEAFVLGKPKMTKAQLDRILFGSRSYARRVELVTALVLKGFELTGVLN
jgi:hypothetical protein